MPAVSVIIPAFNAAPFIEAAILSAATQTVAAHEILVVDDGSSDATVEISLRFSPSVITYVRPHLGGSSTLNYGIERARSDTIAFLDADDIWTKQKLEIQLKFLREHEDIDVVFGNVVPFNDEDGAPDCRSQFSKSRKLPGLNKSTMLIRASVFNSVGLFDTNFKVADFPEWYARAKDKGIRSAMLPNILAFRRIHRKNTSLIQKTELRSEYIRIVRESLRRQGK